MTQLVLAFAAGMLAILSPCVLPLAPIVIAGARANDPRGPLLLALGLAVTFGVAGGALASLGVELGTANTVRMVSAAIMVAIGIAMLLPAVSTKAELWLSPLASTADRLAAHLPKAGLLAQAGMGAVLALAWAPCAGPALGAAFALAASRGSLPMAMITMTVFALGATLSLLAAGYGLGHLAKRGRGIATRAATAGRAIFGVIVALVGTLILTGADHALETAFVQAMPGWLLVFTTRL
jgi:cytochrome c biogenesis protein CcdA